MEYTLYKIKARDLLVGDGSPNGETYTAIRQSSEVTILLTIALYCFEAEHPHVKTFQDWIMCVDDIMWDYLIYNEAGGALHLSRFLCDDITRNALRLSVQWHYMQMRKASGEEYIVHPLAVGKKLWELKHTQSDPALLAAGLCHDLLEDTECGEDRIRQACGEEVLRVVKAVSHDPALSDSADWEEKKLGYIASVKAGGEKAMLVCLADKTSNLESLLAAYEKHGDEVWQYFNRGKVKKLWFEEMVYGMLKGGLGDCRMLEEYEGLIEQMKGL